MSDSKLTWSRSGKDGFGIWETSKAFEMAGGLKALILYTRHCFAFEGSSWKPPAAALPNFFARFVSENCYFNGLGIQT